MSKINTGEARFPRMMKNDNLGPTTYEVLPAHNYTHNKAERPIFGTENPVKFTDYAAKISCSPGPSLRAPKVEALDFVSRNSPRERRERIT
jgi:hypothetical protein